ncbi:UDP-4-amino-4,6-dideoxy-N-acetyl-beta-L-altrosamine N-acetyltransferase [Tumebacillus permanentifrigoris]|uniref:UDP-4-amino-4, 6-dideoxy-N-acetyl-beta-L-altrosamine N-acetyltransferase n=1 Tax=Tumebacillus permanentifrigoris TaxID=378543 RepID=A0A316DDX7_9BACL|nr:UDP-4-amino-4,6-dideoxy-N-acetyl-beta-L-altrosamine N-acetyltransferase [Tumebacillus permanentifrigoris]PWK16175.1 UDP-4-amino-4,6-dideoxy-N-acetyl-beta-L-altrosamine N-acetyltransferase [Tumebacillus permanentifrigoris]
MTIRLRKVTPNDLEMVMNWRMMPEVTKYMYTDPVLTLEDQRKWYETTSQSDTETYWIIELLEGAVPVGLISVNFIDRRNQHCAWAYYIADERARGKGLGTLLECNMYDYVFDRLELNKLWCEVFSFNDKVVQIHQKFGSEVEGEFKEHICKNGQFYDVIRMGITRAKWQSIKATYNYRSIEIQ